MLRSGIPVSLEHSDTDGCMCSLIHALVEEKMGESLQSITSRLGGVRGFHVTGEFR